MYFRLQATLITGY